MSRAAASCPTTSSSTSAQDHAGFAEIEEALVIELGEAAREHAREEGYHFMGPVRSRCWSTTPSKPGRFEIASGMQRVGHGVGVGTLVMPWANASASPVRSSPSAGWPMHHRAQRRKRQPPPRRDPRRSAVDFVIVDLGSTNGTKVNGIRITGEQQLADGDIISFGGTHIRFEAS